MKRLFVGAVMVLGSVTGLRRFSRRLLASLEPVSVGCPNECGCGGGE